MEITGKKPPQGNGAPAETSVREAESQLIGELRQIRSQERSVEDRLLELQSHAVGLTQKPNGAASAAVLAASIGVFVLGLLTTLAEANAAIKNWLNWYNPTGPLSGKTGLAVIAWLAVWLVAHYILRSRETNFSRIVTVSVTLLVLGLLLMFPPIFQRLA